MCVGKSTLDVLSLEIGGSPFVVVELHQNSLNACHIPIFQDMVQQIILRLSLIHI